MNGRICTAIGFGLAIFGTCLTAATAPSWSPRLGVSPAKADRVLVGYLPATHDSLLFVALGEDFFRHYGVAVDAREYKNSPDALKALEAGEVDVAIPGIAAPLYRVASGSPLVIIGGEAWYSAGIVAKKELRAQIDDSRRRKRSLLSPFAGLKVATITQSTGDAVLRAEIIRSKLSEQIQVLTYESPVQAIAALKAGEVDAAMLWSPHMSKVEAQDGRLATVLWSSELVDHPCCRQVCLRDTTKKRAQALTRYLAALIVAKRFLLVPGNQERALAHVKKYVTGVDDAMLRREIADVDPVARHHRTELSPNSAPSQVQSYAMMMADASLIAREGVERVAKSVDTNLLANAYRLVYPELTPQEASACASGGLQLCERAVVLQPRLGLTH